MGQKMKTDSLYRKLYIVGLPKIFLMLPLVTFNVLTNH